MWLIPILLKLLCFPPQQSCCIGLSVRHTHTVTCSTAYFMVYRFQFKFLLVHITPLIFDNANEVHDLCFYGLRELWKVRKMAVVRMGRSRKMKFMRLPVMERRLRSNMNMSVVLIANRSWNSSNGGHCKPLKASGWQSCLIRVDFSSLITKTRNN